MGMMWLTEQQRQAALAACDRIIELNAKLQADFAKLQVAVNQYEKTHHEDHLRQKGTQAFGCRGTAPRDCR